MLWEQGWVCVGCPYFWQTMCRLQTQRLGCLPTDPGPAEGDVDGALGQAPTYVSSHTSAAKVHLSHIVSDIHCTDDGRVSFTQCVMNRRCD